MVLTWLKETYDVDTYHNLVRNIFLNLDPISLKRARQVCKEWDQLVMKEVWGSEEGRREMERRLDMRWREAQPTRREVIGRPGYRGQYFPFFWKLYPKPDHDLKILP